MTQEDKDLLLKDLCARLPYGVICEDGYGNIAELIGIDKPNIATFKCATKSFWTTNLDECKPYLFPLSSMNEEQKIIYGDLCYAVINSLAWETHKVLNELVDWLDKNCFDHRGLIGKGLAINATNLNIY